MVDMAGYGDPSPGEFDAGRVIERWEEIKARGHPLGPERHGGRNDGES